MRRYFPAISLLILFPTLLFAQQNNEIKKNHSPSFRINAYPLEAEMELTVGNSISLMNAVGLNLFEEGVAGIRIFEDADLYIQVFPRYYYNFDNRKNKDKNISGFSGNYVGLYTLLYPNNRNEFWIGPTWGIQRKINDVGHLDLFLGWGFGWDLKEPPFEGIPMSPLIGAKVGIYLD